MGHEAWSHSWVPSGDDELTDNKDNNRRSVFNGNWPE